MSFHYCDKFLDGEPGHRCLCTRRQKHRGSCECLCGHSWGDTWSKLSYDEQRALLGLPDFTLMDLMDRMNRLRLSMREMARKFGVLETSVVITLKTAAEYLGSVDDSVDRKRTGRLDHTEVDG